MQRSVGYPVSAHSPAASGFKHTVSGGAVTATAMVSTTRSMTETLAALMLVAWYVEGSSYPRYRGAAHSREPARRKQRRGPPFRAELRERFKRYLHSIW